MPSHTKKERKKKDNLFVRVKALMIKKKGKKTTQVGKNTESQLEKLRKNKDL